MSRVKIVALVLALVASCTGSATPPPSPSPGMATTLTSFANHVLRDDPPPGYEGLHVISTVCDPFADGAFHCNIALSNNTIVHTNVRPVGVGSFCILYESDAPSVYTC